MRKLLSNLSALSILLIGISGLLSFAMPSVASAADPAICATCPCQKDGSGNVNASDPAFHFVLVNIHKSQFGGAAFDCNNVPFKVYISALLDSLVPWIFTLAIVMIVFSGVQYMASSVGGGDTKAAKQRIIGSIIGVAFYFLIRLVLNQIAPDITL